MYSLQNAVIKEFSVFIYICTYPPLVERITACVQDRTKGKMSFLSKLKREEFHNGGKYLILDSR